MEPIVTKPYLKILESVCFYPHLDKPEVNISSRNKNVGSWKNHQLILPCVAFGEPAATFQWYAPNNEQITTNIVSIPNGSRVTVTTSASGDYGVYKCRATNVVGSTDHSILVNELSEYQ